eukprot:Mrub_08750.p1 GENE.Mrub_08750~~Mrub_08750.p1  ORF type:complete len:186 (+),score=17.48 Mrub_08750:194-751(+)
MMTQESTSSRSQNNNNTSICDPLNYFLGNKHKNVYKPKNKFSEAAISRAYDELMQSIPSELKDEFALHLRPYTNQIKPKSSYVGRLCTMFNPVANCCSNDDKDKNPNSDIQSRDMIKEISVVKTKMFYSLPANLIQKYNDLQYPKIKSKKSIADEDGIELVKKYVKKNIATNQLNKRNHDFSFSK